MSRLQKAASLCGFVFTLLACPLFAMEAPAPGADDPDVEEITVTGQRSLLALRMQVEQAQEEVHFLFNDLNTDDDYDIICREEERLFSRMKQKNCMPRYAWEARAEEGRGFADKITGTATAEGVPANLKIDYSEPRLKEQMLEALKNSPELFDAIVKHAQLLEKLQAEQATYFGEDE